MMLDKNHTNEILSFLGEEARTLMIDEMLMIDLSIIIEHHTNPANWDHSLPIPGVNITKLMQELKQTDETYFNEVLYKKIFA